MESNLVLFSRRQLKPRSARVIAAIYYLGSGILAFSQLGLLLSLRLVSALASVMFVTIAIGSVFDKTYPGADLS
jgi:hypothetical protein